jgi:hypothetical protein
MADDIFVLHLVDSADWVADNERTMCCICTRPFGTFRRKHHCRMVRNPRRAAPVAVAPGADSLLFV